MSQTESYDVKPAAYFVGERRDLIDRLPRDDARSILEIGCGDGSTGSYARQTGRCGRYVGMEMSPAAAKVAAERLDEVVVGNIEELEFPRSLGSFDVLIASEVLEHFVDPWSVLRRLQPLLKPGAKVFASSPNVSHYSVLAMLLRGGWDLEKDGLMDRTHLRWFTPRTFAALFETSGYNVIAQWPLREPGRSPRVFNALTGNRLSHLFINQIVIEAERP